MKKTSKNNKANFIKTKDLKTFEALTQAGFELVDCTDGIWTFINNPNCPLTFEDNKFTYSNTLYI